MGRTFKKVHACSVGDFGSNTKKIPQWITANGGTYYKDVTKDVTHLVTTRETFKQNGPAITEAKKLKTVNIVSYDWLAESLLSKHRRPRLVREYLWTNILKNEKKKTQKRKDAPKKIQREEPVEQSLTDGEETLGSYAGGNPGQKTGGPKAKCTKTRVKSIKKKRKRRSPAKSTDPFDTKLRTPKAQNTAANHRLYEAEGVTYSATLVRPSNTTGNTRETIQLKAFETIKVPHTYATHIKFTRRGLSKTHLLAPLDSNLDTALAEFEGFFKAQTGKEWNDRLDGMLPSPKKDKDGNTQPPHKGWFWFDTGPAESSLASLFHDGKI